MCDCGEVFDLFDGSPLPDNSKVVCEKCADKAQKIFDLEEEISDLEETKSNAEFDLKHATEQLEKLKGKLVELQNA